MPEDREFRDLVRRMRGAQIRFFKTRAASELLLAKQLEKEVDAALLATNEPQHYQPQLEEV